MLMKLFKNILFPVFFIFCGVSHLNTSVINNYLSFENLQKNTKNLQSKISNQNKIFTLFEYIDIDSEEDNTNGNDIKADKDNKNLFQNFNFHSSQNYICRFNHKTVYKNSYTFFPSLCVKSNRIYILNSVLRI